MSRGGDRRFSAASAPDFLIYSAAAVEYTPVAVTRVSSGRPGKKTSAMA